MPGRFPAAAAWRHLGARDGFEALFPVRTPGGWRLEGWTAGLEDGVAWGLRYGIVLDERGHAREARVECRHQGGSAVVVIEGDGRGDWLVGGAPAPALAGCLDVDLEASAFTNAFPVRRLALAPGERAEAPAAWVRAPGLAVERLEQTYARLDDAGGRARYDYAAPGLGFAAVLVVDDDGLVLDYPGIAVRAGAPPIPR
jgi:uncharacterized protein